VLRVFESSLANVGVKSGVSFSGILRFLKLALKTPVVTFCVRKEKDLYEYLRALLQKRFGKKQLMKLHLLVLMAANFGSAVFCMFTLNYMLYGTPNHALWVYESNKYILTAEATLSVIFVTLTIAFVIKEALKKSRVLPSSSLSNR
jgi:hypothetical protein